MSFVCLKVAVCVSGWTLDSELFRKIYNSNGCFCAGRPYDRGSGNPFPIISAHDPEIYCDYCDYCACYCDYCGVMGTLL